jgi:hypothetical protein
MFSLRARVDSARTSLLFPVLWRFDATDARVAQLEGQVAALTAMVEGLRADIERTTARAAGLIELAGEPTGAQVDRRVAELDGLLGSGG